MDDIRSLLEQAREKTQDMSISLLSDAVYRGDGDAKALERQVAKISRALDKALYELDQLEKLQ